LRPVQNTTKRKTWPVALTIAGSDSGGGAGIQADLKTFAALGVHGASAIACLTAQNPKAVLAVKACPPEVLRRQIEAVFAELPPRAVKTGLLFSRENLRVVVDFFRAQTARPRVPLVVDPVMASTSGAELLAPTAKKILAEELLPLATLVMPNLDEAGDLIGRRPKTAADIHRAAREIYERFGCAVLVKGGHLPGSATATDVLFDGATAVELTASRVSGVHTHGTGCTYSAAICAALALGNELPSAARIGKRFVTSAIANSYRIGKHFALGRGCVDQ